MPAKCLAGRGRGRGSEGGKRYVSHKKVSRTDCFASPVKPITAKWAKHSGDWEVLVTHIHSPVLELGMS